MEFSFMIVSLIMVFIVCFTSSMRVELLSPFHRVFSLSSIQSSTSSSSHFPNSLVVMYSPESNKSYLGMCPVPVAAFNTTGKTVISLNKPGGCTVSLIVGVYIVDKWSEAKRKFKDARIVRRIRGNRADFQVFKYITEPHNHTVESVIRLRLIKLEADSSNHCIVDLILLVQHLPFVFTWCDTIVILFLMSALVLINYSTWYFIQLRPRLHDYLDPHELERQWLEDDASNEEQ